MLTTDGKRFGPPPGSVKERGQICHMLFKYVYTLSCFNLCGGNYLYWQDAAPFTDYFSNCDAMGLMTLRDNQVVEDATQEYLMVSASGQMPMPLALNLLDDPARLAAAPWRTMLSLDGNKPAAQAIVEFYRTWHYGGDNPQVIYSTSGPKIERWARTGHQDYEWANRGNFV